MQKNLFAYKYFKGDIMQGFVYIWRDTLRNMYYVGSHTGTPDDGYISSSHWLTAEVRYRPKDFRRKIIKFVDLPDLKIEEYKFINLIKDHEFGVRYYNLKQGKPKGLAPWNKGTKGQYSEEYRKKLSDKRKQGSSWNKGLTNPLAADNARKGAEKLSVKAKGRTRLYREDGTWTWQYP
jgi:hypothetical protein